MLGNFEGSAEEKLDQVAGLMATVAPAASCWLADDRSTIYCEATLADGSRWVEELPVGLLPAEIVRHAAMRLGKRTHPPEAIGDWERWASAWHLIATRGAKAAEFADGRIAAMRAEHALPGVEVWEDVRRRIVLLQADPKAWPGRA